MVKDEVVTILNFLKASYPTFKLDLNNNAQVNVWVISLSDLEFQPALIAVRKLINTSEWPPTIAAIRKAYTEMLIPDIVEAEQAWGMVKRSISLNGGWMQHEKVLEALPAQVREAVKWCGGIKSICQAENEEIIRAQFTKTMAAVNKRLTNDLATGPQLCAQIEAIRLSNTPANDLLIEDTKNTPIAILESVGPIMAQDVQARCKELRDKLRGAQHEKED